MANSQDPRDKNHWFNSESASAYWSSYVEGLQKALATVSQQAFTAACELIHNAAKNNAQIFVCGNGGSAAISEHLCTDWMKGAYGPNLNLKVTSLVSQSSLLTAIANDFSYDEVFSKQLELYAKTNDILICISSSGNSKNILKALDVAPKLGVRTLSFTGFSGGKAREIADVNLHVDFNNYAIVEDAHQALMQAMAQYLYRKSHS